MVTTDKHLLEALQSVAAAKAAPAPAPATPKASSAPVASAPARPAAPAAAPQAAREATRGAAPADARASLYLVIGAGAIALFAAGVFVGRTYFGPARADAAGPNQVGTPAANPVAAPGAAGGARAPAQHWPGDALLLDPARRWTILAITYSASAGKMAQAESTARYLLGAGFPVARPIEGKSDIRILIGGAPQSAELDEMIKRLRALPGPTGRAGEFSTAYPVNIDSQVNRKRAP